MMMLLHQGKAPCTSLPVFALLVSGSAAEEFPEQLAASTKLCSSAVHYMCGSMRAQQSQGSSASISSEGD